MKKKVGILTFHRSHNCGSILESFAMQKAVEEAGYDGELINFSSYGQRDMYYVFSKKRKIKKVIKNILVSPFYTTLSRHYKNYADFINKHLKVSEGDFDDSSNLEILNDKYDMFLAGSDQIWNITIPDYNEAYFLPFVSDQKKKIAYAPSFGSKNILKYSDNPNFFGNLIKRFDYISTRENNGKKWIKDLTGEDAKVVLDPTLLIDKNNYYELERSSNISQPYIFYYSPQYKKNINKFVQKLSKKYNLPVIVWNSKEYALKGLYLYNFKMAKEQDPGIYLDLIKNAKLVITTSFHGAIFSTIYRKKFWVMKNGDMYGEDDRVITLLNQLQMTERLIEPNYNDSFDYLNDVDYQEYDSKLPALKEESWRFLKGSLNDE